MATLTSIYWLCFGMGLVYVVVAGALGAIGGGMDGGDGDVGLDVDGDTDFDFDVDTDVDIDVDVDVDLDMDVDTDFDADGFDASVDTDADHAAGHSGHVVGNVADFPGYNFFNPLSLAGFLFAFGGTGLVALNRNIIELPGLALAIAGGALMMVMMWLIIGKFFYSMQGSSEAHEIDMLGLEAEVITPVEDDVTGEIAYILGGMRYTAPARLEQDGKANRFEKVRIRRMKDNIVYVVPKKKLLS